MFTVAVERELRRSLSSFVSRFEGDGDEEFERWFREQVFDGRINNRQRKFEMIKPATIV